MDIDLISRVAFGTMGVLILIGTLHIHLEKQAKKRKTPTRVLVTDLERYGFVTDKFKLMIMETDEEIRSALQKRLNSAEKVRDLFVGKCIVKVQVLKKTLFYGRAGEERWEDLKPTYSSSKMCIHEQVEAMIDILIWQTSYGTVPLFLSKDDTPVVIESVAYEKYLFEHRGNITAKKFGF